MKKREEKPNYSAFYLFLILFFGWLFTQFIAINEDKLIIDENSITGLPTVNIGESVRNALSLLEQIFNPLLGSIGNDPNGIFLRLIYGLILFWIIGIPLKKVLPDDSNSRISRSSAIALIISVLSASLIPVEWVFLLAESLITFIALGLIFGGLYFIYSFKREEENRFIYFFKAVFSFVLFNLVSFLSVYSRSKVTTSGVVDMVIGFGLITSLVFFIWYLLIKTVSGGISVSEPRGGSVPMESIKRASEAYEGTGLGEPVGEGARWLGKKSWAGTKWAGEKIGKGVYRGAKYIKERVRPDAAQAVAAYQQKLKKELINRINNSARLGTNFMKKPDDKRFNQFIVSINELLDLKRNLNGVDFNRLMKNSFLLINHFQNSPRKPNPDIFYKRVIGLTRVILEELIRIANQVK